MFDGLKDRLSSFRRDAEEEIDEAADEAGADEAAERDSQSVETETETEAEAAEPSGPSPLGDDAEPPEQAAPTPEAAEPTETDDGDTAESSETDTAESAVDAVETAESNPDATDTADTTVEAAVADAESEESESIETDTDEVDAETTEADARRPTRLNRPTTPPEPDEESGDEDLGFGTRAKLFATGQSLIEAAELEEPLFELEMALLESDVEMSVTEAILDRVREDLTGATRAQVKGTGLVVEQALAESLREVISVAQFDFDERVATADKPLTIVFTGVNGVGKTTTIAKLAR